MYVCMYAHRPGKSHGNADGISRRTDSETESYNGASGEVRQTWSPKSWWCHDQYTKIVKSRLMKVLIGAP